MKVTPLFLLVILVIPLVQSEEWQPYESKHFIFYYQESHLTIEEITTIAYNQEELFSRITDLLSIEFNEKITYYLYGNRKDFEGIPGAYAIGTEIRFLCEFCVDFCKGGLYDAHEMTHALANQIGIQHGLLAEGLAVYVEDYYIRGENLHSIIKILHTENRVTPLEDLVEDFWCDILFNYDIAGSFATFLIEEYGIEKFKELYSKPLGFFPFLEVYDKSLEDLENEWIAVVQHAEVTQKDIDIVKYRDMIEEGLAIYMDLGFVPLEYGTYPARAEEGICLFRELYDEDPEEAFSHLDQFNKGMVAWEEAIKMFEEALEQSDYKTKADLFRKAASLYEIAGDADMLILSEKYASAYESLMTIHEFIEQGDEELIDQELERINPILQELGEESALYAINQHVQFLKEKNIQVFEVGIVILLACIFIVKGIARRLR
ncbi:MAG: hypothetical protein HXS48_10950 [Theionarchaea archaeon]|nr:hypothetical protein [Theionarchaea archaeon]